MARLCLTLLGGFQARLVPGSVLALPTKKAQALLAYLALRPGQAHSREKLATLLWGDTGEEQARHSLRQTLFALRKALPRTKTPSLLIQGEALSLNPSAADVDAAAFERLVAEGTPQALEQAATLYHGNLLDGLSLKEPPFEEWLLGERERLRELALEALAKLLVHQSKAGAVERAIQTAVRLLALDPLQEAVHRTLMRLYARQGRRGSALRQYQMCVGMLERELGVEPEPETRQLYRQILQQQPEPPHTPAPDAPPVPRARRGRRARGLPHAPAPDTPLVGREPELARLRQALDEAWGGRGLTVAVLGEAGIGKSRLVEEIAAVAVQRGGRVLLGRSCETERILPFGPWVEALRTGLEIPHGEGLDGLSPVWRVELTRLLPELGEPGSQLTTTAEDYLRLFEAVAQLMGHLAVRRPLLLILEDLHWADEMSVRLLSFLGRRGSALRLLLVATAREEELAGAPLLSHVLYEIDREHRLLQLTLPPLSRQHTADLVRALARAGSGEAEVARLEEQVWAVSQGNPFMVVETMRAIQEGGPPHAPTTLPLPQRVRTVITGRLGRLSPRSRELVAVAAVIGREFEFALLQHAAGLGERDAAEGVEELVRRRVLHGVGERLDFTHDQIREVAYGQFLPLRRKLLHGMVAKALEEVYAVNPEPHFAALGTHYQKGEVWEKALYHLRQAGAQAAERSAHREAVESFEQALAALAYLPGSRQTLEQAIDLRFDLRNSLFPLGEQERILEYLREAETLAEKLNDRHRLGRVAGYVSLYFWIVGDQARAVSSGQRAVTIAAEFRDQALQVRANYYLGVAHHALGDYRRAIEFLARNVESLEGDLSGERFGLAGLASVLSRTWLASCLVEVGEFAEGISRGEEAMRMAEAADHPFSMIGAAHGIGLPHLYRGEYETAIPVLQRGLDLCRAWSIRAWFPRVASALGYAQALSGRVAEALPLLEQAVEQSVSIRRLVGHSLEVARLGEAHLLAGHTEDAIALASRALRLSLDHTERGHQAYVQRLLGEIASHRDGPDGEQAEDHYRQAMALAKELGMRPLLGHCHLGLGALYGKMGRLDQARTELTSAVALFRSMEMRLWLGRAEAALAQRE